MCVCTHYVIFEINFPVNIAAFNVQEVVLCFELPAITHIKDTRSKRNK